VSAAKIKYYNQVVKNQKRKTTLANPEINCRNFLLCIIGNQINSAMKKHFFFLICLFLIVHLSAQISEFKNYTGTGALRLSRTGADKLNYQFTMTDTIPGVDFLAIPHIGFIEGPPLGLHSVVSLENTALCCGNDSLSAVLGVLNNTNTFRNLIKATPTDFYLLAREADNNREGRYHIYSSGISFEYTDTATNSRWLLANRTGTGGQVLTLNVTADTARWSNISNFSNIHYFNPESGGTINVEKGSNIIEPAAALKEVTIKLPAAPQNGDIIALSFTNSVSSIIYTGAKVANVTASASPGSVIKYIYYTTTGKWYNW